MRGAPYILLLGGTSEANALAHRLAAHSQLAATLSLAGRTRSPVLPPIAHRIGGFGGATGLADWMQTRGVTALVDATHPFAKQMPFNAAQAAEAVGVPLLALYRPAWEPVAGDRWTEVATHEEAVTVLGTERKLVFLTVGRQEMSAYVSAPQHHYIVRSIEPVDDPKPLPDAVWLTARGPFSCEAEHELLLKHAAEVIVTKNSGGDSTQGKLLAARRLGLPVILILRPPRPNTPRVATVEDALAWIARVHERSS